MPSSVADLAALGKLVEENRERLLAMLRRRIDTAPIDAEAILQETFLVARRRWDQFKAEGRMTPYAWLFRLARDVLTEEWRKRYRRGEDQVMPLPDRSSVQMAWRIVDSGAGPSTAAARQECQEQVRQALALLKDDDREILWLRAYEDLSHQEIAEVLGLSENTANKRYARALRRLHELWQKLHPNADGNP